MLNFVKRAKSLAQPLIAGEEGQDLVEYSLLLAFIALAAVGLLTGVRGTISGLWSTINATLKSASTTAS